MKRYFAYVRVSTPRQGELGSSLQEQRSAIEAYALRHRLEIGRWYEEVRTAAKHGRRAFNRMLLDVDAERAAGILIHKIDRSARNLRDWASINDLIDRGVEVHFAHDSLDMHTRGGRLAADVQAVVAADYIRNLRDEVSKGIKGRLHQGIWPFPAPVGYLDSGKAKPKTIDPLRGPLVREAFERYSTGELTLLQLRQIMTQRGLLGRTGRALAKSKYGSILQDPFYVGLIRLKRTGETFPGIHEPLVPAELFRAVQAVLKGRAFPRHQKHRYLFSRLIRCEVSGHLLVGERQSGRVYYRCHAPECRGVSLKEADVLSAIATVFRLAELHEDDLRDLRDLIITSEAELRQTTEQMEAQVKLQLAACDQRLARLTDALIDGLLDKAAFGQRRESLLVERKAYENQLDASRCESPALTVLRELETKTMALRGFETAPEAQKREWCQELCSKILVNGKRVGIELRFPISTIAETRKPDRCGPLRTDSRKVRDVIGQLVERRKPRVMWSNELLP